MSYQKLTVAFLNAVRNVMNMSLLTKVKNNSLFLSFDLLKRINLNFNS